jgi:hypothetical protein
MSNTENITAPPTVTVAGMQQRETNRIDALVGAVIPSEERLFQRANVQVPAAVSEPAAEPELEQPGHEVRYGGLLQHLSTSQASRSAGPHVECDGLHVMESERDTLVLRRPGDGGKLIGFGDVWFACAQVEAPTADAMCARAEVLPHGRIALTVLDRECRLVPAVGCRVRWFARGLTVTS